VLRRATLSSPAFGHAGGIGMDKIHAVPNAANKHGVATNPSSRRVP
jgi:hypothetical protein